MTAVIIIICAAVLLCAALLALAWRMFKMIFARGPIPVNPGANAVGAAGIADRMKYKLGLAMEWINAHSPEKLELTAWDGTVLRAWLIRAEKPTNSFVVGVHGYKSSMMSDIALSASFYYEEGKNLLLVDDRAHGSSGGKYTGFGWLDRLDVIDWCRYLTGRFGPEIKLMLHGVSMGATTVCCASGEKSLPEQVLGVVSDCGFSSAKKEMRHVAKSILHIPSQPLMGVVNIYLRILAHYSLYDCDAAAQIKKSVLPFLFIHGDADKFVPPEMARELYSACPGEKELLIVPGAIHAMSWLTDTDACEEHLRGFMKKIGF